MIGQRALDDPRNGLVRDFVRLVDELQAQTFVFENVKGLCCTNPVGDSYCEFSVIAGGHEQTHTRVLQNDELASL